MGDRDRVSRELRLSLAALESGAVDVEQIRSVLRAWVRGDGRTMEEILGRRFVDAAGLAELEERIRYAADSPFPSSSARIGESPATPGPATPPHLDPTVTVFHARRKSGQGTARSPRSDRPASEPGSGDARYRVLRPHARGGLGEISLAHDRELDRRVALKELQARRAHDPDAQSRFLVEARITGRLEHPGIVPVYSLGRYPDGRPYYTMRLIEGETLREAIERFHADRVGARRGDGRALAFRRLLRALISACNAVAYAHNRGVIHRDLKPDNIMLGPFGETLVLDWGLAKSIDEVERPRSEEPLVEHDPGETSTTRPGAVIGTPRYMSPEQAAGDLDHVGPASDIYSLGAILYNVLVGHAPFPDGDLATVLDHVRRGIFPAPRRLKRGVDPTLEAICLRAMSLNPARRHESALQLAAEIEAWEADVRYRSEQEQALVEVRTSLTRLRLERAQSCFGRSEHAEGMLWLARALEDAPPEPPDLQRVIRTSLAGWYSSGKLLERSIRHAGEILSLAFCPEGKRLVTAGADHTARVWDVSTGSRLLPPLRHEGPIRAVTFAPDGAQIATGGDDGMIRLWDALSGDPIGEPIRGCDGVDAIVYSPDGGWISASGVRRSIVLWDTTTRRPIDVARTPFGRILSVAFSPDGSTLAVADEEGLVWLLDAETARPLGEPIRPSSPVSTMTFDPVDGRLLTGGRDGWARLWDTRTRGLLVELSHPAEVRCLAFRPDGGAFATACAAGPARLWNAESGAPLGEPLSHASGVDCLAFRPDGTLIATGDADGTARLWCAFTGLPVGPTLNPGRALRVLRFSPDGRRIAAAVASATASCWTVPDPIEGDVERISCWVSVTTDLEFDAGDAIRRMDGATSWDRRRRLNELGGSPFRDPDHRRPPRRGASR